MQFADMRLDQLPPTPYSTVIEPPVSGSDLVYFPDAILSDIGKIQEMASKASLTGVMTAEDFRQFRILCFETEWFNKVTYEDGR